jgi:hypothetical protein
MSRPIDIRDLESRTALVTDKRVSLDAAGNLLNTDQPDNSAIGTAASKNVGTAADQVPLNSDLGSASTKNTGTDPTNVPLNSDLGSASTKTIGSAETEVPLNSNLQRPAKYQLEFEGVSSAITAVSAVPSNYLDDTGINTLSYRTRAECTALGINYPDGGGAKYTIGTGQTIDEIGNGFTAGTKQILINLSGAALFEQWGAVGNNGDDIAGAVDDTASMQAALNTEFDINAIDRTKTYLTSNTLFNQRSRRTVDFKGSRIRNRSNNKYAIVSIPGTLTTLTDAALAIYLDENHYGEELTDVKVKNLFVKMNPKAGGGSNLGVGMIYCLNSNYSRIFITGSNGNGAEMRQCEGCVFAGIFSSEYRSYGIFMFQCENCIVHTFRLSGGVRAVVVKQCRQGKGTTNNVIRDGHILNQSNTYWIAGGSNFEAGGGALYPAGHEVIGEVLLENILLEETDGLKTPGFSVGNFCRNWTLRNLTFKSNNGVSGLNLSIGIEGDWTSGGQVGDGHLIDNCKFLNIDSRGNACIAYAVSHVVKDCKFTGAFDRVWLSGSNGPTALRDKAEFRDNNINGNIAMSSALSSMGCVCDTGLGWKNAKVINNDITLTPIADTGTTASAMYIASDRSTVTDNDVKINYFAGANAVQGINIKGDSMVKTNTVSIAVGGSLTTRHISLLGTEQQFALGNTLIQDGTSTGVTSGVRYQASTGQTDNNMFIGSFTNNETTY